MLRELFSILDAPLLELDYFCAVLLSRGIPFFTMEIFWNFLEERFRILVSPRSELFPVISEVRFEFLSSKFF